MNKVKCKTYNYSQAKDTFKDLGDTFVAELHTQLVVVDNRYTLNGVFGKAAILTAASSALEIVTPAHIMMSRFHAGVYTSSTGKIYRDILKMFDSLT